MNETTSVFTVARFANTKQTSYFYVCGTRYKVTVTCTVARLPLKAISVDINYVFVIFILLFFCAMFVATHIENGFQVLR